MRNLTPVMHRSCAHAVQSRSLTRTGSCWQVAGECFTQMVEDDGQRYRAPRERLVCAGNEAACLG